MSDHCEWPEFFSERISKSRRAYKCCECGQPIQRGQLYWYCSGKWDGKMNWYRQHIECRDACYVFQLKYGECIPFGCLREELSEMNPYSLEEDGSKVKRSEIEVKMRQLLAAGLRASRSKDIQQYNLKWKDRKP